MACIIIYPKHDEDGYPSDYESESSPSGESEGGSTLMTDESDQETNDGTPSSPDSGRYLILSPNGSSDNLEVSTDFIEHGTADYYATPSPDHEESEDESDDESEEEERFVPLECIASDMQALRPLISYAVRMPPKLEDKGDHEVENHYHKIEFCDGRSWYVMLRLGDMPDPGEYMGEIDRELTGPLHPRGAVESEVLSLQAMKKAGVELVPNAYLPRFEGGMYRREYIHSAIESESAHFYMDVMPGFQCPPDLFPPAQCPKTQEIPTDPINRKILLESFVKSYADHQIQLSKLRFDTMCQLEYSPAGEVVEGPILDVNHWYLNRRRSGPFTSLGAFHTARIEALIADLNAVKYRPWMNEERNIYLTLLECKRWIKMSKWANKERHEFYLRHREDQLGNYLVADGKLSGVLEWEDAFSTIKEEAFGSPDFMRKRTSSIGETLDAELSEAEALLVDAYLAKGRGDLAGCVRGGKIYRALWCRPETMADVKRYKEHLQVDDGVDLPEHRDRWLCDLAAAYYKHDVGMIADYERARGVGLVP